MVSRAREGWVTRYRTWSNEDLVRAATLEPDEYTEEALELIENELAGRSCSALQRQELLEAVRKECDETARSLTGVRGLLVRLIFFVGVVSIAALASAGNHVLQAGVHHDLWFFTVIEVCQGAFGLVVCALLTSRNPSAPRHAATWVLLTMSLNVARFDYFYFYADQAVIYPIGSLAFWALWLHNLEANESHFTSNGGGNIEASTLSPGVALDS